MRLTITTFLALFAFTSTAYAAPTDTQLCQSAMELASAKYAQCRLTAESKDSKAPDPAKLAAALGKCSQKLSDAFGKATLRYGANCAATEPSSAFDAYLTQCSDDATAAAGGAALPDYVGDLASCNTNLATANTNLATCEALPPSRVLKTGQTIAYGPGSDGDLQKGVAQNYADNGDGTITDTSTGLMWEKKSDDGSIHDKDNTYTWSGASSGTTNVMDGTVSTTFLAALNAGGGFAGYTDWRVPNRKELESLAVIDTVYPPVLSPFAAFDTGCGVNSSGNPGCTVTTCSCAIHLSWSSSTYVLDPQLAWYAFFTNGGNDGVYDKGVAFWVRAVRGG